MLPEPALVGGLGGNECSLEKFDVSIARRADKGVACVVVVDLAHDVPEFIVDLLSLSVLRSQYPEPRVPGTPECEAPIGSRDLA